MARMIDRYGRVLNYVRISITDRCNYRCRYCMPENGVNWFPHEKILTYEDLMFMVTVLRDMGVKRIRFTGGEPFVRKGFLSFLKHFQNLFPDIEIAITTNGSLLTTLIDNLREIRLSSLNISLDTLDPEKFNNITRIGNLQDVIEGIRAAASLTNIPLKINTVLIRNFNDNEIPSLISFAAQNNTILRLIEFMPLDDVWNEDSFISSDEIFSSLPMGEWKEIFSKQAGSTVSGPARYYRNIATGYKLGIISAVSHHFCNECNRLRITALGEIKPCLFSDKGVDLGQVIREKDRIGLESLIMKAVSLKPSGWHDFVRSGCRMSRIGG